MLDALAMGALQTHRLHRLRYASLQVIPTTGRHFFRARPGQPTPRQKYPVHRRNSNLAGSCAQATTLVE